MNDSTQHNTKKYYILITAMVLVAGVVVVSLLRDRMVNQPQWTTSVTGRGKVAYVADMARVTLRVQIDKAQNAETALKQLTEKITAIKNALATQGISDGDIHTQHYSIYPQHEVINEQSTLVGYAAGQQVVVTLPAIVIDGREMPGVVIEAATKAGANQVLSVSFEVSNLEELKQQARLLALADAKNKAGSMARAAGVTIKKPVGWWENMIQYPGLEPFAFYGDGKGGGGSAPFIPVGTQEVIIEIGVNYLIK